ncbi:unnamed protein product [Litomosoides sigmodontis]|uniref:Uncharacterized protein n=1 Tax=Litomosoides sigmodontis TaxID=42156 RepID=A0A3P6UY01_LITSI|nr:unnamed protein product [Litomosoides sigmodontis]
MTMSSVLRKFIRTKRAERRKKHIMELQTVQEQLRQDLNFWDTKLIKEKQLIESLQNQISSLSDEVEDAKDALFSEIDYQSSPMECEIITKMESEVEIGRRKCKELSQRIENCKREESAMRKELDKMNLRIEENEKYKIHLLHRKEMADRIALYWRQRQQQSVVAAISGIMDERQL